MPQDEFVIDKRDVRRSFERAAETYDRAAVLQREVCDRMAERLEAIGHRPAVILDAGCGTGYGTQKLLRRHPRARLVALDVAHAMLARARIETPWWARHLSFLGDADIGYVCGDAEHLPLNAGSVGMVWSSLALQWCDVNRVFAESHRVLEPGGLLIFSTLGPYTLVELRTAFDGADRYNHVNRFTGIEEVGEALAQNGFLAPGIHVECITLTYDDVAGVMRDLKAIGAHNVTGGRRHGLTGKSAWRRVVNNYEAFRRNGKLPATFQVLYGHGFKARAGDLRFFGEHCPNQVRDYP